MATRWGIVGCGKISSDFTACIASLPTNEHTVVAAAALTLDLASDFGSHFKIPKAYGTCLELALDADVEIVHVGVTNDFHYEVVITLLQHGKHVLCEKPMGMNAEQTKTMIKLAREKGLFLMEGLWSRFFPTYESLRNLLASGTLGDIVQVNATLGLAMHRVERIASRTLGGGAILDVGAYVLQLANMAFAGKRPVKVTASGHLNQQGVDEAVVISLLYSDGEMACLNLSSRVLLVNDAYIVGSNGTVKIESPFWCPTTLVLPSGKAIVAPLPTVDHTLLHTNSAGLVYEIQEIRRCLLAGLTESPLMTLDETQYLTELRDEIRRQIGLIFACDENSPTKVNCSSKAE